jgi:hypothetical protein
VALRHIAFDVRLDTFANEFETDEWSTFLSSVCLCVFAGVSVARSSHLACVDVSADQEIEGRVKFYAMRGCFPS